MTMRGNSASTVITKRDFVIHWLTNAEGQSLLSALINPGSPKLFPWLSNVAASFDRYVFRRLSIQYVPRVGLNTDGAVTICYDPSSTDPVPNTNEML